jgi:cell division protein FtsW
MIFSQRSRAGVNRYDGQNLKLIRKHRPDYMILILSLLMLTAGLIVMYAISPALAAQGGNVSDNYFVARQFVAILLGVGIFFLVSRIQLDKWQQWSKVLLAIVLVASLVAVFDGGGKEGLRWIQFGFFSFQPVEFLKFVVIISLAGFLSKLQNEGKINDFKSLKPVLAISAVVAIVVVILQRDLGSAVVLASIVGAMIFSAGFPMKKLLLLAAVALTLIVLAISSTPYRRDRFMTFMNPERDCQNDGYHACQALIAVGSGGLIGLGLGRSVQAYGYLPEAENDSIFAIFAEKFGFLGVVLLLGILGALLLRLLNIMQRAPNSYAQLIVAGVFTWLAVQSFINIAAMVGLIPLKGITLPFISYGGTSLVFAMAALGLVFNISYYTSIREPIRAGKDTQDVLSRRKASSFGSRVV